METQIVLVLIFTFTVNLIGTLGYAVRIVGARTGRIAISFSLFNVFVLVARMSNTVQASLLTKFVEENITNGRLFSLTPTFRWILFSAAAATFVGAVLVPTFQRVLTKAVEAFAVYRSVPQLLLHSFSKAGVRHLHMSLTVPKRQIITNMRKSKRVSIRILLMNTVAVAIVTVSAFSALYAGTLNPDLRATAAVMTPVVTGVAAVLMALFIDPYLSMMTDDVVSGQASELHFRQTVIWLIGSRLLGTLLAQLLLIPIAHVIIQLAERI